MTERPQFVRLFQNPKSYKAPTFQVFWKSNETGKARLGITIKGRLSSVWRMRLKRVVREWFRQSKETLGDSDFNIVLRIPPKLTMDYPDALKRHLREWIA